MTPQIVILIVILLFYIPISRIIKNASEVAFGDTFSFKVEKALKIGDPELAEVVNKLTKEEIITLISTVYYKGLYAIYTEKNEIALDDRYDYYISLQQKKLFDSTIDLTKIKEMIESKPASNEDVFFDPVFGSSKRSYYSKSLFSQEELKLLEKTSGKLSPLGQRVYWLIVDAAAEQMSTLKSVYYSKVINSMSYNK